MLSRSVIEKAHTLAGMPPSEEIIPGLLDDGVVLMAAKEGTGKTFMAIKMGVHVAAGHPWGVKETWNEKRVRQGLVVYCIAEGVSFFPHRVMTAFDRLKVNAEIHPFYIMGGNFNLMCDKGGKPNDEIKAFIEMVRAAEAESHEKARLIVFDTLNRFMPGGDENNQMEAGALIDGCFQLKDQFPSCAIMLLHHMRKDQGLVRGSTVLTANVDEVLVNKMYGENTTDGPMVWTTKEKGKRKDHGPVEEWVQYVNVRMSDGTLCDAPVEYEEGCGSVADHYYEIRKENDEGEWVGTGKYQDTLVIDCIPTPSDPILATPLNKDLTELLGIISDASDPIGIQNIARKLNISTTKAYKMVDVLEARELIARGKDKKYKPNVPANPFGVK